MERTRRIMDFDFWSTVRQDMHFHQELELVYLLDGKLELTLAEERHTLEKGDFLLVNANKKHSLAAISGEVFLVRFAIDYGMLAERMGTNQLLFWCNTAADRNEAYDSLRTVLDQILNCYFRRDEEGGLYVESLYYEALYILTSYFMVQADDVQVPQKGMSDNERVFEIQNYVQSNYDRQISLNDLANQLYLSNAYLSKYIKKRFGLRFVEYLTNVRLFHAVDDLLYTDKKIVNIALDNGFPTTGAFNKAFRNYYSMTPSVYRTKMRQEQNSLMKEETASSGDEVKQKVRQYLAERKKETAHSVSGRKSFTVDANQYTEAVFPWAKVINISDMELLQRADVRTQVLQMKEELQFTYVRIWNVFVSSMYNEKAEPGHRYNFNKLDRVVDFLLSNQIKPFFELAFKPAQLIYTTDSILIQDENEVIFSSASDYEEALQELAAHLMKRYSREEIEQWYFELWHDPRMHIEQEASWYYENFEVGYRILKGISDKIKVGGAGFALGYEQEVFRKAIRRWVKRPIRPDFLSLYAYSYIVQEQGVKKSLDSSFLENQVANIREEMKAVGFAVPEIYVTEWNFTISNRNRLNDSCAAGAFVMRDCIAAEGVVDMLAYWHGTDIYSEYYDATGILSGDSGLITRDGIRKPTFYAFYFLKMLEKRMLGKNENAIITAGADGSYKIACHNSRKLTYRYAVKEENEITYEEQNSLFEDTETINLKFRIRNVENGNYLIKTHYINEKSGSVQETWNEMGFSVNLLQDEIEYLKRSAMPHVEMRQIQVKDGILRLENVMLAHEIRLIEVRKQ